MPLPSAPFDPAKSIYAGMSIIQLKFAPSPITAVTAAITGVFTKTAHGLRNNVAVRFDAATGGTGFTIGSSYYVIEATANTFKLAATAGGVAITPSAALTAVTLTAALVFEAKKLTSVAPEKEFAYIELPGKDAILRPRRKVTTKRKESFTFHFYEIKRLLELFGGKLDGDVEMLATMWIPDPQDETGKIALKSEDDVSVYVSRDGELGFGEGFSEGTIRIESRKDGDIIWTSDAVV